MIKNPFFEKMKDNYIQISKEIAATPLDGDDLMINYDTDLDKLFLSDMEKLSAASELLHKAKDLDDKITVQAALVYMRVFSIRLSGFFEDIKDDADAFLKESHWPKIPEDYQVPEHYQYPFK
ncbi:hypothetical protein ACMV8I_20380 [Ewingella sp. S1.OA.A_B6]